MLIFKIKCVCNNCGIDIEDVAEGPVFRYPDLLILKDGVLADGTSLQEWEDTLCDGCAVLE